MFGHPGWQFGPRSVNVLFPRPCRRLDRWDTQAIRLGSAFLEGAFVFWEKHDLETSCPSRISVPSKGFCCLGKHDLEKVVRLGSAFLAGAFVFWEKHDLEIVVRLESAFLAGAFDFWEKHEPWLLLPCYSMTMEIAKLLRAPRHAPTQVAKA